MEPVAPIRGGSVSTDSRVRELKAALFPKAALLAIAEEDLIRAFASDDTEVLCAAASRIQSIGFGIGDEVRKWQRSVL